MDSTREYRKSIALETLEILQKGFYIAPNTQHKIDLHEILVTCVENSILYTPHDFSRALRSPLHLDFETQFFFVPETTLGAAKKLVEEDPGEDVVVLNFASAKNPGGGFLKGSQAQEESIARSSGLYQTINNPKNQGFYTTNSKDQTCLYTHSMIYSPKIPIFRTDDFLLLDQPYFCSFISSPAVNAGHAVMRVGSSRVAVTMRERIERILAVAVDHGHRVIVLGAWGCGVFKNELYDVAKEFRNFLYGSNAKYGRAFSKVVFAIPEEDKCMEFQKFFLEQNSKPIRQQQQQQQKPNSYKNQQNRKNSRLEKETKDQFF